jgi:hypothetical protein
MQLTMNCNLQPRYLAELTGNLQHIIDGFDSINRYMEISVRTIEPLSGE